ncbi:MAG TPA: ABC transporter ATP-binding protein [Acidimicrobiales bacterium]|nr:ABC transporter ATP-binding protein [Acidimicrobiales bacterium]
MPKADVPLLELRSIRAGYDGVEALYGIDFSVQAGSLVGILGPNGAGKSTTLKVISGLLRPTSGSVLLEGQDVTGVSAVQLARAGVCLIPEGRGIFPNLTVRENVLMDSYTNGRTPAELEEVAYARFPVLAGRRQQVAGTLSGGEQQMLSLSRALSTDPALILLDELSMGLAPLVVEQLFKIVRELTETGVTTVVVEQFADVVLDIADEVVVMSHGRVRLRGAPKRVRKELHAAYLGKAAH